MLGEKNCMDAWERAPALVGRSFLLFQARWVYNQFGQSDEAIAWLKKAQTAGYSQGIRDYPNLIHVLDKSAIQELLRGR